MRSPNPNQVDWPSSSSGTLLTSIGCRGTSQPRSRTSARAPMGAMRTSTSTMVCRAAAIRPASISQSRVRRRSTTGRRAPRAGIRTQIAVNRPFRNTLALRGAYTLSRAKNMTNNDEDGWTALTWNTPLMYDQNFALAGFDRTHNAQLGVVWEMPFFSNDNSVVGRVLQGWHWNGIVSAFSGAPCIHWGTNPGAGLSGVRRRQRDHDQCQPGSETYRQRRILDRAVLSTGDFLAADGRERGRLREQRPQQVPPSACLERGHVALQIVPGGPPAAADPGGGVQRLQPHDVECAGDACHHVHRWHSDELHGQQLHALHAERAFVNPRTVVVGLRFQF